VTHIESLSICSSVRLHPREKKQGL